MTLAMKAIPTEYNGCLFRSRLEARWAAWFDLVGWKWDYEPMDLPRWAPDFLIAGATPILVEVKPALWTVNRWSYPELPVERFDKVRLAAQYGEVLCLGVGPTERNGTLYIGATNCHASGNPSLGNAIAQDAGGDALFGFCHEDDSYVDRISGHYPGGSCGGHGPHGIRLWRQAGRLVQWEGVA